MDASFLGKFEIRLKELRESQGLTLQNLADETGINRVTLTNYENGNRHPDERALTIIAKYFEVSLDYLVGISNVKSYDADVHSICEYTGLNEQVVKTLNRIRDKVDENDMESKTRISFDMLNTINTIFLNPYLLWDINNYLRYDGLDHVYSDDIDHEPWKRSEQRSMKTVTTNGYVIELNDEIMKAGLMASIQKDLDSIRDNEKD